MNETTNWLNANGTLVIPAGCLCQYSLGGGTGAGITKVTQQTNPACPLHGSQRNEIADLRATVAAQVEASSEAKWVLRGLSDDARAAIAKTVQP